MSGVERFTITVEAGPHSLPAATRLRALLKTMLRTFGLRCVEVRSLEAPKAAAGRSAEDAA